MLRGESENHFDHHIPVEGYFSLTQEHRYLHVLNPVESTSFLILENEVEYPVASTLGCAVTRVLLDEAGSNHGKRVLALPDSYVTMTQALNDTIGGTPTFESKDLAKQLFVKVGEALATLAQEARVLPENIHYRQIIFSQEQQGLELKLLPPLTFVSVDDENYTHDDLKMLTSQQLLNSCRYGAANSSQKDTLPFVFKGFVDVFRWN